MSSKLDIINQGLLLLGESVITDYDTPVGIIADTLYKTTRDSLLASHRWRFAVKKVALVAASGSPVNEWQYHYTLPSDYVLLIRTYPNSNYEVFEDKLLSNLSTASIDYVFDPGEKKYPTYFIKALTHALASDMALSVTHDKSMADLQHKLADRWLARAKHADSQGRPQRVIQRRPFIDVRK